MVRRILHRTMMLWRGCSRGPGEGEGKAGGEEDEEKKTEGEGREVMMIMVPLALALVSAARSRLMERGPHLTAKKQQHGEGLSVTMTTEAICRQLAAGQG